MRYGRIYDDIWPENVGGYYCADLTHLAQDLLDWRYPEGWEANTHLLLVTRDGAPYLGNWHRDAPPYEQDSILLVCLAGIDEFEYEHAGRRPPLVPGDRLLLPAGVLHRGRCSTYRITYHCRVGPKGKVMPESPMTPLPPMTLRRFLGRTWRTVTRWIDPPRF